MGSPLHQQGWPCSFSRSHFIGVPRIIAWALAALAVLVFAAVVWVRESKRAEPQADAEPRRETEAVPIVRMSKTVPVAVAHSAAARPAPHRAASEGLSLQPAEDPPRRSDFISTTVNADLDRLHAVLRNKTQLQATALVALAMGRSIQFEGDVYSVTQHPTVASVGFEFLRYTVFAHFEPEDAGPLMALNRGDRVVIRGELSHAEPGNFVLEHSRLLGISPFEPED
jgi:hypothetical protein